jgi:hypothetical protein
MDIGRVERHPLLIARGPRLSFCQLRGLHWQQEDDRSHLAKGAIGVLDQCPPVQPWAGVPVYANPL